MARCAGVRGGALRCWTSHNPLSRIFCLGEYLPSHWLDGRHSPQPATVPISARSRPSLPILCTSSATSIHLKENSSRKTRVTSVSISTSLAIFRESRCASHTARLMKSSSQTERYGSPFLLSRQRPMFLRKNAPIMGRRLISCKLHLPLVQQKVLGNASLEIAVSVGSNPHNSRLRSAGSPILAALVEKIDPVFR